MSHISTLKTNAQDLDIAKKAMLALFKGANQETLTENDLVKGQLEDSSDVFPTEYYIPRATLGTSYCGVGIGFADGEDTLTLYCDSSYDHAYSEIGEKKTSMRTLEKAFNAYYSEQQTLAELPEGALDAYQSVERNIVVNENGDVSIAYVIEANNQDSQVLANTPV